MISVEQIRQIAEEFLAENETGHFLVELNINPGNAISIAIDNDNGNPVTIDDCVALSKYIEGKLDREVEDFEMEVASAGIGYPFQVHRQYVKNVGQDVEVVTKDGLKRKGLLLGVTDQGIELETEVLMKIEGQKGKQIQKIKHFLTFQEIKSTRVIISFH